MVLKHSRQRRHVILKRGDGLIDQPNKSGIIGCEKGDTNGILKELGGSFVCTIGGRNLDGVQQVVSNRGVRGVECGGDVTRRDQHAVDLVDEYGTPLRRVDNSNILTRVNIRTFDKSAFGYETTG